MKRIFPLFAVLIGGTVLMIALMPFVNIHRVRTALSEADRLVSAGSPEAALEALSAAETLARSFPPLAFEVHLVSIRALMRSGAQLDAEARAAWLLRTDALRPAQDDPASAWAPLRAIPAKWVYRGLSRRGGIVQPYTWDRWGGFVAVANELQSMAEGPALLAFVERHLAQHPESPLEGILTGEFAASRRPPAPAMARAVPPQGVATSGGAGSKATPIKESIASLRRFDAALAENPRDVTTRNKREALLLTIGPVWGIVKTENASVYDAAGASAGRANVIARAPHGTPIDIDRFISPATSTLVLVANGNGGDPTRAVRLADVVVRPGSLSGVSVDEQRLWASFVKAQQHYTNLKQAKAEADLKAPEVVRYQAAHAAQTNFYARMKVLLDQNESSRGDEEVRDELRKMNYEQPNVDAAYKRAKARFLEWRDNRTASAKNPEFEAAKRELIEVRDRLRELNAADL